jgi:hypothetical protein
MTTALEFDRDPDELREIYDPLTADASDLQRMLLTQNVRLTIGGQTVLEGHISLMLMCFGALDLVKKLESGGGARLEIPEGALRLEFKRRGASVTVHETYFDKAATTQYEELVAAWRMFAIEARAYLLEEFPGLAHHPEVGSWFAEQVA